MVTGSGTGASAVLDGFTITGGSASNVPYPADSGGGMYNYLGSPTVRNCIFRYNLAGSRGGAMFNQEYNSTVSDCIFAHNRARNGGAMYNSYSSSPTVTNCTFYFNQALEYGGAAQDVFNSHPTFSNCTFSVNTAGNSGGAIGSYAGRSHPGQNHSLAKRCGCGKADQFVGRQLGDRHLQRRGRRSG